MRALTPRQRQDPVQRSRQKRRCAGSEGRRADRVPPQDPVHLPGPLRLAQPAHDGARHPERAAGHPRHRRPPPSAWSVVKELMSLVGLNVRDPQALPPQLLRRPAPAHRHRPRAGPQARSADLRRAGLGARRLDPGPGAEPAEGSPGEARPHLSLHLPQSGGGRLHRRPDHGHVRRAASSRSRPAACCSRNPLHPYTKALLTAVPEPNPDYRLAFDKLMEGKASQPGRLAGALHRERDRAARADRYRRRAFRARRHRRWSRHEASPRPSSGSSFSWAP